MDTNQESKKTLRWIVILTIFCFILHALFYSWYGFMLYIMGFIYWLCISVLTVLVFAFVSAQSEVHYGKKFNIEGLKTKNFRLEEEVDDLRHKLKIEHNK